MYIDVEKRLSRLRRKFARAIAKCRRVESDYLAYAKQFYCPWENTAQNVISTLLKRREGRLESELQFVTSNYSREQLYTRHDYNGVGFARFRVITDTKLNKLRRLECAILDAWEKHHEIYWELNALTKIQPSLFYKLLDLRDYTDDELLFVA